MLNTLLLMYLGIIVKAPEWYFWIAGAVLFAYIIQFGYGMYKSGHDWRDA